MNILFAMPNKCARQRLVSARSKDDLLHPLLNLVVTHNIVTACISAQILIQTKSGQFFWKSGENDFLLFCDETGKNRQKW